MKKSILLSGEALQAGLRIQAITSQFGEAVDALREEFNGKMQVLANSNMEATKAQWNILATALDLDPVKEMGKWTLVTEYTEHGHMYVDSMEQDAPPQAHPLAGNPQQPN